jgi:hypothetical protein
MATPQKELQVSTSPYDGNKDRSSNWLFQVSAYLRINMDSYDTDKKRIILTLSLMNKGTAARWAEVFYQNAFSAIQQVAAIPANPATGTPAVPARTTNIPDFGGWDDFCILFKKAFSPVDLKAGAMLSLTSWKMRKGTYVSDHIATMNMFIARAQVTEDLVKTTFLLSSLEPEFHNGLFMS